MFFFDRIGWDKVYTAIRCDNIRKRSATKPQLLSEKSNGNNKCEEK